MKHLFLIDPLPSLNLKNDSSTLLIQEGLRRSHEIYIATLPDLLVTPTLFKVRAQKVLQADPQSGYKVDPPQEYLAPSFQLIWLRKNPPFDETYLMHLALLDELTKHKVAFINNPSSIRALNEKLTILNFPQYIIQTIVTMNLDDLKAFWQEHGKIVLKGLTGFGGDAVILVEAWAKSEEHIAKLTQGGKRFIMAQKFIEKVYQGDKRVTVVNGKILGALLRVPPKNSFIAYTGGGATVETTTLTDHETMVAQEVALFLKKHNIFWAGLDLIDGYLSEINITSPSLLAAANTTFKIHMERPLWDEVEATLGSGK